MPQDREKTNYCNDIGSSNVIVVYFDQRTTGALDTIRWSRSYFSPLISFSARIKKKEARQAGHRYIILLN